MRPVAAWAIVILSLSSIRSSNAQTFVPADELAWRVGEHSFLGLAGGDGGWCMFRVGSTDNWSMGYCATDPYAFEFGWWGSERQTECEQIADDLARDTFSKRKSFVATESDSAPGDDLSTGPKKASVEFMRGVCTAYGKMLQQDVSGDHAKKAIPGLYDVSNEVGLLEAQRRPQTLIGLNADFASDPYQFEFAGGSPALATSTRMRVEPSLRYRGGLTSFGVGIPLQTFSGRPIPGISEAPPDGAGIGDIWTDASYTWRVGRRHRFPLALRITAPTGDAGSGHGAGQWQALFTGGYAVAVHRRALIVTNLDGRFGARDTGEETESIGGVRVGAGVNFTAVEQTYADRSDTGYGLYLVGKPQRIRTVPRVHLQFAAQYASLFDARRDSGGLHDIDLRFAVVSNFLTSKVGLFATVSALNEGGRLPPWRIGLNSEWSLPDELPDRTPDIDLDGVVRDRCPFQAEDFDGFEDDDGCPDTDHDHDGVPDSYDQCLDTNLPRAIEDHDGFEDHDGCLDADDDDDGIPDVDDQCPRDQMQAPDNLKRGIRKGGGLVPAWDSWSWPDEAWEKVLSGSGDRVRKIRELQQSSKEDFDGDRDEDGCPDLDRDGDNWPQAVPVELVPFQDPDEFAQNKAVGASQPALIGAAVAAFEANESGESDQDKDGRPDSLDNCPLHPNNNRFHADGPQADRDGDGAGDACDEDDDGDGVLDRLDNCRSVRNTDQLDSDRDGLGNACDGDDDGDGIVDELDKCTPTPGAATDEFWPETVNGLWDEDGCAEGRTPGLPGTPIGADKADFATVHLSGATLAVRVDFDRSMNHVRELGRYVGELLGWTLACNEAPDVPMLAVIDDRLDSGRDELIGLSTNGASVDDHRSAVYGALKSGFVRARWLEPGRDDVERSGLFAAAFRVRVPDVPAPAQVNTSVALCRLDTLTSTPGLWRSASTCQQLLVKLSELPLCEPDLISVTNAAGTAEAGDTTENPR